jgi:signal transduction histidine kinase
MIDISHKKKNSFLIFITFFSMFLLISCQKKEEVKIPVFVKLPEEKLDSLAAWFNDVDNYNKEQYLPRFYVHFNEKLKAKQWEKSAQLLRFAGKALYFNAKSDKKLLKTHIDFITQHEKDISDKYKMGLFLNIGSLYNYSLNHNAAIYYLNKATQIQAKDYKMQKIIIAAYNEMSYNYASLGKLDKGLETVFMSLRKCEEIKDTLSVGAAYDGIAWIYQSMKDYENAEKYYDKAVFNFKLKKHNQNIFAVYLNKLALYKIYKNEKLFPMIETVFEFYKQNKLFSDDYKIKAYSYYSYKLLKENKTAEAGKLLKEVKPLFEKADNKSYFSTYFTAAALYDQNTGSKTIDENVFKSVIPIYKENRDYESLAGCFDALKEYATAKKDYKSAFYYLKELQIAEDSLASQAVISKTKELDKKYQTTQKEQKITLQKQEIEQKNTSIALLIASLVGLFLLIIAYYLWQKQKTLKQDKTNSMNFTKQLLENTEVERKRIATDLHDSISHELLNLKSIFKQDLITVNTKIDSIINDIRGISRNLHPVMFDKIGLVPNIEQLVERFQTQNDFLVHTEINYSGSLTSADELQIYRITQEALTNIVKYAKAHAAKIIINEEKDGILIEIKDNGKGFNVKETLNSGKAFGLHNIIERSRAIGGVAQIESSTGGTVIHIKIPKKS